MIDFKNLPLSLSLVITPTRLLHTFNGIITKNKKTLKKDK